MGPSKFIQKVENLLNYIKFWLSQKCFYLFFLSLSHETDDHSLMDDQLSYYTKIYLRQGICENRTNFCVPSQQEGNTKVEKPKLYPIVSFFLGKLIASFVYAHCYAYTFYNNK